jgi:hypothetical protein
MSIVRMITMMIMITTITMASRQAARRFDHGK